MKGKMTMEIEMKANMTITDELHQLNTILFTNITYDAFVSALDKVISKLRPNDAETLSSQSRALANSHLEHDGIDEWIKRCNMKNTINAIAAKYAPRVQEITCDV